MAKKADTAVKTPSQGIPMKVKVSRIKPGLNPRTWFDPDEMESLKKSIEAHGLLQPMVVRCDDPDDEELDLTLIAGERRFRTITALGWEEVTVMVKSCSEVEAAEDALSENMERTALNAVEEGQGFLMLMHKGRTQQQIAERMGKSQSWVANRVRLTNLPASTKDLIASKELTPSYGVTLASISDYPEKVMEFAARAIAEKISVKDLDSEVQAWKEQEEAKANPALIDVPPSPLTLVGGDIPVSSASPVNPSQPENRLATPEEQQASMDALANKFGGYASDSLSGDQAPEGSISSSTDNITEGEATPNDADDPTQAGQQDGGEDTTKGTPDAGEAAPASPVAASSNPATAPVMPAASDQKDSAPASNPAPTAPAAAPLPEGWTNAPVRMDHYNELKAMGLWPLSTIIEYVKDLEAEKLPESIGAAAQALADFNRDHETVFVASEQIILDEMFPLPKRKEVTATMIIQILVSRRYRIIAEKLKEIANTGALPAGDTIENAGE